MNEDNDRDVRYEEKVCRPMHAVPTIVSKFSYKTYNRMVEGSAKEVRRLLKSKCNILVNSQMDHVINAISRVLSSIEKEYSKLYGTRE